MTKSSPPPHEKTLVNRTVDVFYTMIRRSSKVGGREKRGPGEDFVLVAMDMEHKKRNLRLGEFTLEQLEKLLGKTHTDYVKILEIADKFADGDKSVSTSTTRISGSVNSNDLVTWGKTFKQAYPYMMYYSNYFK